MAGPVGGWEDSAGAWIARIEAGDELRQFVVDPAMLRLAGDVASLNAADIGCGEGRFSRMLAARGASVTGIDPTRSLVARARELDPVSTYLEGNAESLPLGDSLFDLVVSYLVLLDIPDYRLAVQEMARVLKPGDVVLVANLNGFVTASSHQWVKAGGRKLYFTLDDYSGESGMRAKWAGIDVVNYHRPLNAYITAFLEAGFRLSAFEEPLPSPADVVARPGLAEFYRIPWAVVMKWVKA